MTKAKLTVLTKNFEILSPEKSRVYWKNIVEANVFPDVHIKGDRLVFEGLVVELMDLCGGELVSIKEEDGKVRLYINFNGRLVRIYINFSDNWSIASAIVKLNKSKDEEIEIEILKKENGEFLLISNKIPEVPFGLSEHYENGKLIVTSEYFRVEVIVANKKERF